MTLRNLVVSQRRKTRLDFIENLICALRWVFQHGVARKRVLSITGKNSKMHQISQARGEFIREISTLSRKENRLGEEQLPQRAKRLGNLLLLK